MSNALTTISVSDVERMATAVAKSGLFGVKTPEQAMALMLIAQAEGSHPAIAARDYHIIDGKPSLKADAMMARFQQAGGKVNWLKNENTEVSAEFSHPSGGKVTITWTMEDAKRAGFAGKSNWQKFPRQMLRARVVSEGIRTVYPGVVIGVYTPEEVEDFDNRPARDMGTINAKTAEPAAAPAPAPQRSPTLDLEPMPVTTNPDREWIKEQVLLLETFKNPEQISAWRTQTRARFDALKVEHQDYLNDKANQRSMALMQPAATGEAA